MSQASKRVRSQLRQAWFEDNQEALEIGVETHTFEQYKASIGWKPAVQKGRNVSLNEEVIHVYDHTSEPVVHPGDGQRASLKPAFNKGY